MNFHEKAVRIQEMIATMAPKGTKFEWSRATTSFGKCKTVLDRYTKEVKSITIYMSRPLVSLNEWAEIEATVIHEIAHAFTPGHNHDAVWRAKCIELGGNGERCFTDANQGGKVIVPKKAWNAICPVCGHEFGRDRAPKAGTTYLHCGSRLTWKRT